MQSSQRYDLQTELPEDGRSRDIETVKTYAKT